MPSYMANGMNQSSQTQQPLFSARGPNILVLAAPQPGAAAANLGAFKGATAHLTPAAQAALEEAWEAQAFAEDLQASGGAAHQWPPRSYACTFCAREFRTAQALGGHMNVHRRERAQANQLALLRPSLTHLATSGAAAQAPSGQLQAAGGPLACVITRLQEGNPFHAHGQALPHVDASQQPELAIERRHAGTVAAIGRATLKLAAAAAVASACVGKEGKCGAANQQQQQAADGGHGGAGSGYLERPSSPAQSASNSPLSSPRPSQCSSSSNADGNSKKSRKRSLQPAAPDCGIVAASRANAAASFMQILQPGTGTASETCGSAAPGLGLLPFRAFQPYDCTEPSKHHSAAAGGGVMRMRLGSGEWARGLRNLERYCGDTECEDSGLDLELRL